jgi:serine protease Do
MSTTRSRHLATLLLVVGAVVFGMVLAGGLGMTAPGLTEPDRNLSATQLAAQTAQAMRGLPSFADLAAAVDPAVVSIQASTIEKVPNQRRRGRGGLGQGQGGQGQGGQGQGGQGQGQGQGTDPFEFFFGPRGRQAPGGEEDGQQQPEDYRSDAGGSGFVISPEGLVITNYHVVEGATEVKVHLGERDYVAKVKGTDPSTDIALLKIEAGNNLRYLELGDDDHMRVGDWVMVVGNPLNLDKTVTTGVISAKHRAIGISNDIAFENFLQTDAAINFGNSGGPLINLQGQVVGIATAINYGAENIGFAVPVNTLREVLPQLESKGKVSRGYLGIQIQNIDYQHSQAFGLKSTDGALVTVVTPRTPAADAGVQHGDIVTAVDGRKVVSTRDLINYVSAKGPTASVTLTILRDNKTMDVKVKLSERPVLNQQASNGEDGDKQGGNLSWLGMAYQAVDPDAAKSLNLPDGVAGVLVTNVAPTSPLYDQGVRAGNVIGEVNGHPIKNASDFEHVVGAAKPGSFLRLYTYRQGRGNQTPPPFYAVVQVP